MPAAHELTPFPMLDKEEEQTENDFPLNFNYDKHNSRPGHTEIVQALTNISETFRKCYR